MEENKNELTEQHVEQKEVKKQKPSKTGVVPTTELELGKVAVSVCKKWKASPWLTLLWKKELDFTKEVSNYNKVLSARVKEGASRPQITVELAQLDFKIEDSLIYVKNYILEKHKKEKAKSYYASFGFVRKKDSFIFPTDQSSRLEALKLMVEAIEKMALKTGNLALRFGLIFRGNMKLPLTLLQKRMVQCP